MTDHDIVLQDLSIALKRLDGEVSDLIRWSMVIEQALEAYGIVSMEFCSNCCELRPTLPWKTTLCPHCGQPIAPPGDSCGETVL